jgi:hypothetical protein
LKPIGITDCTTHRLVMQKIIDCDPGMRHVVSWKPDDSDVLLHRQFEFLKDALEFATSGLKDVQLKSSNGDGSVDVSNEEEIFHLYRFANMMARYGQVPPPQDAKALVARMYDALSAWYRSHGGQARGDGLKAETRALLVEARRLMLEDEKPELLAELREPRTAMEAE